MATGETAEDLEEAQEAAGEVGMEAKAVGLAADSAGAREAATAGKAPAEVRGRRVW